MGNFGVLFGRLVRERRGIEDLSQDDLASRSGLTKARISDIERGKIAHPQAKTVDALCVALEIPRAQRMACYASPAAKLPERLLEMLAQHFGHDSPNARESDLEKFLLEKAKEFSELRDRLKNITQIDKRVTDLLTAAGSALEGGDFNQADALLDMAERAHLETTTLPAIERQAQFRIERGNVALVSGAVSGAASHFDRACEYFRGVDQALEARCRYRCADLLRLYAYRFRNIEALHAARSALAANLLVWSAEQDADDWCKTKNALGGVSWRLSHFDMKSRSRSHAIDAAKHYSDVREACLEREALDKTLAYHLAAAHLNLANVYSERCLATTNAEYEKNLMRGLGWLHEAMSHFTKSRHPEQWGILQHNLGCLHIKLSSVRTKNSASISETNDAIQHLERSFDVRTPETSPQYWVASCRSLAEALINMAELEGATKGKTYRERAVSVLVAALEKVTERENPNQWGELQQQLARCETMRHG